MLSHFVQASYIDYIINLQSMPQRTSSHGQQWITQYPIWEQLYNNRVPTKISEKSFMIFPWLLQAKIQISRQKKIPLFAFAAHVSICRINHRQTQTHTHTQTHTWFDQGQPTIQLILLVIELIQEVKTTLVNLIKMGNRISYQHLKNYTDFSFPYRLYI